MNRAFLGAACLIILGLSGCLSTHHEEYHSTTTVGLGPGGVEASRDGDYTVRDWKTPWFRQPAQAQP